MTTLLLCLLVLFLAAQAASARPPLSVRQYAHTLILARWGSEAEWLAADAIIRPESNWNPCASYPSRNDCRYTGSSSCGVPQANPCPMLWRGRLWETRYAQVRWFIAYVARRYGSPTRALSFRRAHGWY